MNWFSEHRPFHGILFYLHSNLPVKPLSRALKPKEYVIQYEAGRANFDAYKKIFKPWKGSIAESRLRLKKCKNLTYSVLSFSLWGKHVYSHLKQIVGWIKIFKAFNVRPQLKFRVLNCRFLNRSSFYIQSRFL